jgi:hypothetical protein
MYKRIELMDNKKEFGNDLTTYEGLAKEFDFFRRTLYEIASLVCSKDIPEACLKIGILYSECRKNAVFFTENDKEKDE